MVISLEELAETEIPEEKVWVAEYVFAALVTTQFVQPVTVPFMVMEPKVSIAFEYTMAQRVVAEPR